MLLCVCVCVCRYVSSINVGACEALVRRTMIGEFLCVCASSVYVCAAF